MEQVDNLNVVLEKEAGTDELTNLYNKRGLKKKGKKMFEYCRENGIPLSCLYIDIDYFKIINDKFGHEVGDAIIAAFAETIASEFRENDIVFQARAKHGTKKTTRRRKRY